MNELDVVRVKQTVLATPWFEDDPIEVKAGWEGTIVAHADTDTPCIEFNEEYRGENFLVDLNATNLEVIWEFRP
jgi:hypothetical protein